jgi:hypothetical protein
MGNRMRNVDPIIFHDVIEEYEETTEETLTNE